MNFNEYQEQAISTAIYPEEYKVLYPALGLANEAGECLGKIKKVLRDDNGKFSDEKIMEIGKEVGDTLWYLASLVEDLGLKLDNIAKQNIEKLQSRKERGVLQGSGDNR